MIKLCTVGTSNICDEFLSAAKLQGEYELEAVYSRNYETGLEFARKHNCKRVFTDLQEMAKDKNIDAVYIASPNAFHYNQSRLFLENSKHVICEKPITTNLSEYKELKSIADNKGLIYAEAIMSRHNKEHKNITNALEQIGKIRYARLDFHQRSSRLDRFLNGEKINIFDMSLKAGSLMDLGVYCVYATLDLLGKPKAVLSAKSHFFDNGADYCGTVLLDYEDFTANLSYGKAAQSVIGSEIIGDGGAIIIPSVSQFTNVSLVKKGEKTAVTKPISKVEAMVGEAQAFADYILRFDSFCDEYNEVSALCRDVIAVMDEIKQKAGIIYPETI